MSQLNIRPATEQDIDLILHFVRELAIYEKAEHEVKATPDHVRRTLFCANPAVFGLSPFNSDVRRVARAFGGMTELRLAMDKLITLLYLDEAA